MFNVEIGKDYKVSYARSGITQTGKEYAVVALVERDNQPANAENPSNSKSVVKMWLDKLPKGVVDGCMIQLSAFTGMNWVHKPNDYNGKVFYRDEIELIGAKIKAIPEV